MSARWLLAILGAALLAGCSQASSPPPTPHPSVTPSSTALTSYKSVTLFHTSGAIRTLLHQTEASTLLAMVAALPGGAGPKCQEPPDLVYRLVAGANSSLATGTVIEGYRCAAAVKITQPGHAPAWRTDASCRVDRAIRRLSPTPAEGTRTASVGCQTA